jgi:hypothetical protein
MSHNRSKKLEQKAKQSLQRIGSTTNKLPNLYSPLQPDLGDIRLIKILRGDDNGPVQLEMIQGPLSELAKDPGYEALSYVWGDATDTRDILLNSQPFPVTKNLEAALRHLRKLRFDGESFREDFLWIDAICIHQNDIQERNAQVRRMMDIFGSATLVVIWLGEGNEDSERAMDFMNRHSDSIRAAEDPYELMESVLSQGGQFHDEWVSLFQGIMARPWWGRVWIVQEVVAAKSLIVLCGMSSVDWLSLVVHEWFGRQYHINIVFEVIEAEGSHVRAAESIDYYRWAFQLRMPILLREVVLNLDDFEATLPVDQLYGFYGLCADSNADELDPSYDKPFWQVYAQFMKYTILQENSLNIVCAAGDVRSSDLPSWVPALHKRTSGSNSLIELDEADVESPYSASGKMQMQVSFSEDKKFLRAKGLFFRRIKNIPCNFSGLHLGINYVSTVLELATAGWHTCFQPDERSFIERYGNEKAQKVVEKVLTADIYDNNSQPTRLPVDKSVLDISSEVPEYYEQGQSHERRKELWQDDVRRMYESKLVCRCLGLLDGGNLGLIPESAAVGDMVCILFGCDVPVVLRADGDDYVFIGGW